MKRISTICVLIFNILLFPGVDAVGQLSAGYWQFVSVEYHERLAVPDHCYPSRKEGSEGNLTATISKTCGEDLTPLSKYKAVWSAPPQILVPSKGVDFKASVTLLQNRNVNWTLPLMLKGKFLPYNAPPGQASFYETGGVGPQGNPQSAGRIYSFDNLSLPTPVKVPGHSVADDRGLMQFMVLVGCLSSEYWWNYVYKWTDSAADTKLSNLARGKRASQSSTGYGGTAGRAVDGNTNGDYFAGSMTHTEEANLPQPWWQVDLGRSSQIDHLILWNRKDCCGQRLSSFWVFVSDSPFPNGDAAALLRNSRIWHYEFKGIAGSQARIPVGRSGRFVRIQLSSREPLSLAEVEVFGK